jgi:fructose-bisphosphate aldolase class II
MAQKNLSYYFKKARKEKWALAQFNFSCAEQLQGIVQAAVRQHSPLLVGTSEGDAGFLGIHQAVALVGAYRKEFNIPIFLNFDHGKSLQSIRAAIEAGYDAVHIDASRLGLEENILLTRRVVQFARKNRIQVVEGEIGEIPGHSTVYRSRTSKKSMFSDPSQAERFAKETGVDNLAVNVGSAHGIYKGGERLNLQLLQEIKKRVQCGLVLHGGSGVNAKDVLSAIKLGVVKVNISTDLRLAFSTKLREVLSRNPEEITPYNIFPPVVEAVQKVAAKHMQFFGSANKI